MDLCRIDFFSVDKRFSFDPKIFLIIVMCLSAVLGFDNWSMVSLGSLRRQIKRSFFEDNLSTMDLSRADIEECTHDCHLKNWLFDTWVLEEAEINRVLCIDLAKSVERVKEREKCYLFFKEFVIIWVIGQLKYTASQKHESTLLQTYVLNEFLTADRLCTGWGHETFSKLQTCVTF